MEALFFICGQRPGLEAAGRGMAPSPGAGSPAPASALSPAGGVGGSSAGLSPFSQAAGAGVAGVCGGTGCVVELISFALQAHNVAIEEAQHFRKITVKSVFGEVWFRSDCQHAIINEVAVEDSCFGSLKTDALAARGLEGIM